MNRKLIIGGEEADTPYNMRTTKFILDAFRIEAFQKGKSINELVNKALLPLAKKYKAKQQ